MDIVGHAESAKQQYHLGEPVLVTLFVKNAGKEAAFLFVPTGRAGGIKIEAKKGAKFEVKDMLHEPDQGLQPERRVLPGEMLQVQIPVGEWLVISEPGDYVVECTIPIDVSDKSLREGSAQRSSKHATIRSTIRFTVVSEDNKNKQ